MDKDHEKLSTESARAGETPHITRYVLLFSTVLVVAVFAVLLLIWAR